MNFTNPSIAVFLMEGSQARAIAVNFDPADKHNRELFKTFDQSIKVDDVVLFPTASRVGFSTGIVVETDVDFDLNTTKEVRWLAGVVDTKAHARLVEQDKELGSMIRKSELRRKRTEMREAVMGQLSADEEERMLLAFDNGVAGEPETLLPEGGPTTK